MKPLTKSGFAGYILASFVLGCALVLAVEILEQLGFISKLSEAVGRFSVWAMLLGALGWLASNMSLERHIWWCGIGCALLILSDLSLDVTEDIAALASTPIIGHSSQVRPIIEKLLMSGWTATSLAFCFLLIRSLDQGQQELVVEKIEKTETIAKLHDLQTVSVEQERMTSLGTMSCGIAHDLNNALTPILTYCELLERDMIENRERAAVLSTLKAAAKQATGIVQQIQVFNLSRETTDFCPVELTKIVQQAKALTKPAWHDHAMRSGSDISIQLNLMEGATVLGNAVQLTQVLTNLLINATKAMPHGGTITIRSMEENGTVVLEVVDDGIGMSEDTIRHCFEAFFSRYDDRPNGFHSSGLGLFVCKEIVERHRGTISVDSEPGIGTRFVIKLPNLGREAASPVNSRRPSRVLYVDDEPDILSSMGRLLRALGTEADLAQSGQAALDLLASKDFDLMISDFGLPGMTGDHLVQVVKGTYPDLPIIVVSGWPTDDINRAMKNQILPDAVEQKPLSIQTIEELLNRFLSM